MTDTDQEREDEVLRRMLKTPPKPHKGRSKARTLKQSRAAPEGTSDGDR